MTTPLAPLPKSSATNAYDLLTDVIRVVEEEHRRLYMGNWFSSEEELPAGMFLPACGTVACVGGWIVILTEPWLRSPDDVLQFALGTSFMLVAREKIIGDTESLNSDAMRKALTALFTTFPEIWAKPLTPGTSAYVLAIVDRIRDFQSAFEPELRARTFPSATA